MQKLLLVLMRSNNSSIVRLLRVAHQPLLIGLIIQAQYHFSVTLAGAICLIFTCWGWGHIGIPPPGCCLSSSRRITAAKPGNFVSTCTLASFFINTSSDSNQQSARHATPYQNTQLNNQRPAVSCRFASGADHNCSTLGAMTPNCCGNQ